MARETFIYLNGEVVPKPDGYSAPSRVHVISDIMPMELKHPVTGLVTDSKSRFRRETKASGCVELGNDAPTQPKRPELNIENSRAALARVYESMR